MLRKHEYVNGETPFSSAAAGFSNKSIVKGTQCLYGKAMFRYCPSCASPGISFERQRVFRCSGCGFVYYHNTAAAAGCIVETGDTVALLVRAKEPSLGKLDLPGGFIDPGEGVVEGLRREFREEIGWDPGSAFSFFASFPNIYPYKGIEYNTCDLFFILSAPGLQREDLRLDPGEIADVRFLRPAEIDPAELAFDSTRRVIRAYLERGQR
jgi:NADH pyrophosphatase NudC (nudix superfamily)